MERPPAKLLDRVRNRIRVKGYSIRTVQGMLWYKDVSCTMIYTHVLNISGRAVRSPLDKHESP